MKRFSPLLGFLVAGSLFVSCGPSQEQIDAQNNKTTDSLDSISKLNEEDEIMKMMATNDSLDKVKADSIQKAQLDSVRTEDSLKKVRGKKNVPKDAPKK